MVEATVLLQQAQIHAQTNFPYPTSSGVTWKDTI